MKDNNLYISPVRDEKEKDKPKEEVALTMDGTTNLRYDAWSIIWSPDSGKLADSEGARRAGTSYPVDRIQSVQPEATDPAMAAIMRSRAMCCLFICLYFLMWRHGGR